MGTQLTGQNLNKQMNVLLQGVKILYTEGRRNLVLSASQKPAYLIARINVLMGFNGLKVGMPNT